MRPSDSRLEENSYRTAATDGRSWLCRRAFCPLSRKASGFLSILLAVAVFVAFSILPGGGQLSNDDWTISCLLSGRYTDTGPCLFVNALLSDTIIGLSRMGGILNWLFIIERISALLAFIGCCYVFLSRTPVAVASFALCGVIVFFLPGCLVNGNFTFVAAFTALAGVLCLLDWSSLSKDSSIGERRLGRVQAISGCALFFFGFLLRAQAALMVTPFVLLSGLWLAVQCRTAQATVKAIDCVSRGGLAITVVVGLCVMASAYDHAVWSQPELHEWREYNAYRAQISDYPMPSYEAMREELAALGVSENDYWLVTHWTTDDNTLFSKERLRKIAEARDRVFMSGDATGFFEAMVGYVQEAATNILLVMFAGLLVLGSFVLLGWRGGVWAALFVLAALVLCGYFWALGRLPERVEMPIWGSCIVLASYCMALRPQSKVQAEPSRISKAKSIAIGALVPIVVLMIFVRGVALPSGDINRDALMQYISQNEDRVLLWDASSMHSYENLFRRRMIPQGGIIERNIKLGGWTTQSPQTNQAKEKGGVAEGISSLVGNSNAYYISVSSKGIQDRLLIFLREHYYPTAEYRLVDELVGNEGENYSIWQFAIS